MSDLFRSLQTALADRYQLERELGHGGMATVYLATDLKHTRRVALKVLRPELVGILARERFLREIRISSEFSHPHILPLLDSGTLPASADFPDLPFYTMPFVEGESLRDRLLRDRQLPLEDALGIAREVAAALAYAHAHGVVHRDIKPENILLTAGHAVVADFGIARAIQEAADPEALTSAGLVVGTPAYMSPEQAAGETSLDGRSDLYSLGCVVYEMLVGDPPFTGSSPQAVMARHRLDPVPSLRVVRSTVPLSVEQAVKRTLQKSPADRFRTAEQFGEALRGGRVDTGSWVASLTRRRSWALLATVFTVVAWLGWSALGPHGPPPDANKVVGFPLAELGAGVREGTGQEISLMIGSALEHADPLRWLYGWTWMDSGQRADLSLLGAEDARAIARRRGAGYYLDGAVVASADSNRVILRLNDVQGDSVVAQATAAGAADLVTFPQLAMRATNQLLPRLLGQGRRIDLAPIADRAPAAIAHWLQGEREYRLSHYHQALVFQRRAVEADSGLAFAALKGALAAEWEHAYAEAAALVELALRNDSLLPPKYQHFALALRAYYAGDANASARHLQDALRLDSTWSEGWMALGEVRYHLLPDDQPGAAEAFARARDADPEFGPPLFHLAQIALHSGDAAAAALLIGAFRDTRPDSLWLVQLDLTLACLERGPDRTGWAKAVREHPDEVVQAAKVLASTESSPACAEAAFRAILASDSAPDAVRWGAVLGLQGLLTAEDRLVDVSAVLDAAVERGILEAKGLYVVQAAAGSGMDREAAEVIGELSGDYGTMGPARLWYHGTWLAHRGDRVNLAKVEGALVRLRAEIDDPLTRSTANAIGARLALLDGDTAGAIALLRGVSPVGGFAGIEWGVQPPFGGEQLLLAELLLARGEAEEAIRIAGRLDHPAPIIYLVFLRSSLELRLRAARLLGNTRLTSEFESRLTRLTQPVL